jgi:hypothetical protein
MTRTNPTSRRRRLSSCRLCPPLRTTYWRSRGRRRPRRNALLGTFRCCSFNAVCSSESNEMNIEPASPIKVVPNESRFGPRTNALVSGPLHAIAWDRQDRRLAMPRKTGTCTRTCFPHALPHRSHSPSRKSPPAPRLRLVGGGHDTADSNLHQKEAERQRQNPRARSFECYPSWDC